jgi:hypothetical protein
MTPSLPVVAMRALFTLDVSAASGLVAHEGIVSLIADDALVLHQVRLDGTRLPDRPFVPGATRETLAKPVKPDLEALVDLGDGRLLAFGSGSTPMREAAFLVAPAADPLRFDLHDLYAALRSRLGTLNLEGAAFDGDRLVLAHRGAGTEPSALALLPGAALRRGLAPAADTVEVRSLTLPALGGVALSITDLARHPDGRLFFLATAENTANAVDDGPVAGSVIGILDAGLQPRLLARLSPDVKAEGLAYFRRLDGSGHWLVVADADDPNRRSPLFALEL